mmetsp:Transcript_94224/g.186799  ORF Transcript_94224/g.186799 Transcript_94224/m.186799 type:complete len:329 (+) Transcript_94224:87-1073(+)
MASKRRTSSRVQTVYMHDYGNGEVKIVTAPVNDMGDNTLLPRSGPDDLQTWRDHVFGPKTSAGISVDEACHELRRAFDIKTGVQVDPNRRVCPICGDTLRYPRTLECRHDVCEACFDKWNEFGVSTDVCPSCMDPQDNGGEALLKKGITLFLRAEHAPAGERGHFWGRATACLYQAAGANPESPIALTGLGAALYHHGESLAALHVLQAALELDPDCGMAHYYRGVVYSGHGDDAAAQQAYENAVETDPCHYKAYHNLGCLLHKSGKKPNMARAHDAFQEAIDNNAKMFKALHSCGAIQLQQGDTAGATQRFASVRSAASTPSGMNSP